MHLHQAVFVALTQVACALPATALRFARAALFAEVRLREEVVEKSSSKASRVRRANLRSWRSAGMLAPLSTDSL